MIFVSPDGERSMNTYLGAGADLDAADVPGGVFEGAKLLFLEGYLYDKPEGKTAFEEAARQISASGGQAGSGPSRRQRGAWRIPRRPFCCRYV